MKKKSIFVMILLIIVLSVGLFFLAGRKTERQPVQETERTMEPGEEKVSGEAQASGENQVQDTKEKISSSTETKPDYSGMGNQQGNTENGGNQTWVEEDRILINTMIEDQSRMFYFDTKSQKLSPACDKDGCLHNGTDCTSGLDLSYLQSYGSAWFGVPINRNRQEIWKIYQGEASCIYKSDQGVEGIWCYDGWLYYMTEFGVYRTSLEKPKKAVRVLDRPVLFEYLTFYKDSMYFCEEDRLLYRADLDGKNKTRLLEEKVLSPQIYKDHIYFRSAEYDKNGMWEEKNTLFRVSLEGKSKKKMIDQTYLFHLADDGIYYTDLPEDQETTLYYMDLKTGNQRKIADCYAGYVYLFPETDWIVIERTDGELKEGEEGGKPTHLYCVRKDGSGCRRLEYPQMIEE